MCEFYFWFGFVSSEIIFSICPFVRSANHEKPKHADYLPRYLTRVTSLLEVRLITPHTIQPKVVEGGRVQESSLVVSKQRTEYQHVVIQFCVQPGEEHSYC